MNVERLTTSASLTTALLNVQTADPSHGASNDARHSTAAMKVAAISRVFGDGSSSHGWFTAPAAPVSHGDEKHACSKQISMIAGIMDANARPSQPLNERLVISAQ